MPTISTRIDENTKSEADEIANRIGIPLSTAINIFVKRFVAERGFPFAVVATDDEKNTIVDVKKLDAAVKKAVTAPNNVGLSHHVTYLDTKTNKLITEEHGKE